MTSRPQWFVPGDVDGLLALGLDNLIQILLNLSLCGGVLGYPPGLVYGTILPAVGVSLVVGNGAYALQAWRLARAEGRGDRTALPYGINTVSLFPFVSVSYPQSTLPSKRKVLSMGG